MMRPLSPGEQCIRVATARRRQIRARDTENVLVGMRTSERIRRPRGRSYRGCILRASVARRRLIALRQNALPLDFQRVFAGGTMQRGDVGPKVHYLFQVHRGKVISIARLKRQIMDSWICNRVYTSFVLQSVVSPSSALGYGKGFRGRMESVRICRNRNCSEYEGGERENGKEECSSFPNMIVIIFKNANFEDYNLASPEISVNRMM